ncbi:MAG: thiaminase II [Armatimonadetes bacterium CG2_30_59_28]|nr:thiaminase II [Armatimonadota bacterium]OIO89753.1 MAG: thiaminase II [Armatimonadetes bacterium CG2_30_59_28]PIU66915.1 MAG: thiaminase II [Armatimonadetes bacterium CG07_land_8_20_14_0_80_59_28]PIX44422.1 MAG: thiaminase II [Armatimonadetes bacterium CG_4_8_14_3_um_filter_58_9]PIY48315.1 MAG: thiaminase II [Armatimonadetes bacterium CG_4_10_14_3_um_filter_59_10]
MSYTTECWNAIAPIYSQILAHPFVTGLTQGDLAEDAFRFYAIQDALYLQEYARGLALLAARSPQDDWVVMFSDHAKTAIVVERELHASFFRQWNLTDEAVYATPMAPTNLLYTSYLLRVAYERPFHEALGAFLPCYWIYLEVGKALQKQGSPRDIYQQWADTYASQEFEAVVRQVLSVADDVAETLTDAQRSRMRDRFVMTSRFEYMFWDMGYRKETWPLQAE